VSLGCTGEFEVFKAGSWIILDLHCDSQTCYRQKPAAKAFWKTFKGKNMPVTHIRSTLNPHHSIQKCLECVLVQGRIQGSRRPGGQEQKPVPQERNFTGLVGAMTSELFTPSHKINTNLSKAASRPQTTALKYP